MKGQSFPSQIRVARTSRDKLMILSAVAWMTTCMVHRVTVNPSAVSEIQVVQSTACFGFFVCLLEMAYMYVMSYVSDAIRQIKAGKIDTYELSWVSNEPVERYLVHFLPLWTVMMLIKYMLSLPFDVDLVVPFAAALAIGQLYRLDKKQHVIIHDDHL